MSKCKTCKHDGNQMLYPSGCGVVDGEYANYQPMTTNKRITKEIIRIRDMALNQIELNTYDYDDEDVLLLNDQAIDIYFELDKLVKNICGLMEDTQ